MILLHDRILFFKDCNLLTVLLPHQLNHLRQLPLKGLNLLVLSFSELVEVALSLLHLLIEQELLSCYLLLQLQKRTLLLHQALLFLLEGFFQLLHPHIQLLYLGPSLLNYALLFCQLAL